MLSVLKPGSEFNSEKWHDESFSKSAFIVRWNLIWHLVFWLSPLTPARKSSFPLFVSMYSLLVWGVNNTTAYDRQLITGRCRQEEDPRQAMSVWSNAHLSQTMPSLVWTKKRGQGFIREWEWQYALRFTFLLMQGLCCRTMKDNCVFTENKVIFIVQCPEKTHYPSKCQTLFVNVRLIKECGINSGLRTHILFRKFATFILTI